MKDKILLVLPFVAAAGVIGGVHASMGVAQAADQGGPAGALESGGCQTVHQPLVVDSLQIFAGAEKAVC